jgi:hypothetical protein
MTSTEASSSEQKAATLRALHVPGDPLVLPNAWDAASARIVEAAGFPVVATSSFATARILGYDDGEAAPVEDVLAAASALDHLGSRGGVSRRRWGRGGRERALASPDRTHANNEGGASECDCAYAEQRLHGCEPSARAGRPDQSNHDLVANGTADREEGEDPGAEPGAFRGSCCPTCDHVSDRERGGEQTEGHEDEDVERVDRDLAREPRIRNHIGGNPDDEGGAGGGDRAEASGAQVRGRHTGNLPLAPPALAFCGRRRAQARRATPRM